MIDKPIYEVMFVTNSEQVLNMLNIYTRLEAKDPRLACITGEIKDTEFR